MAMAEGFVVKVLPSNIGSIPRWLLAEHGGAHHFGPREKSRVFPNHAAAAAEAKKWGTMLKPAFSVFVEPV
jgi:hypothetical protein